MLVGKKNMYVGWKSPRSVFLPRMHGLSRLSLQLSTFPRPMCLRDFTNLEQVCKNTDHG
jgi:hypothetical protein